jgi:hypothetical protein
MDMKDGVRQDQAQLAAGVLSSGFSSLSELLDAQDLTVNETQNELSGSRED